MSQSLPERQVISRRRARRAPAPAPAEGAPEQLPISWGSLLAFAIVVALVIGAGYALGRAIAVQPTGAFANCKTAAKTGPHTFAGPPRMCIDTSKTYLAKLSTTAGEIDIAMPAAKAPQTVNNFVVLAVNGYYTGLTFHRVDTYFVQGGDPQGDGHGGPGYTLPDETNDLPWTTNAVGMARDAGGPVNGSQFFLLKTDWPGTGPGDTAFNNFGTVLGGTQIVTAIKAGDRILSIAITVQ
ncbi:MAG TPA: peptidylprolyl isomerase [Candidatus Dormibacteraeota bacterium]